MDIQDDSDISEYSQDSTPPTTSPDKKPRRSFLQAPKSYTSKLQAPYTNSPSPPLDTQPPKTNPIPIPVSSPPQNTITEHLDTQELFIGDRVTIGGIKTGTLLYYGVTHLASGQWCGIALDEADGIHDGFVNGTRYFTCRNGHGIFAPVERVSLLDTKATKVVSIIKSPPKVSQIPSKSKLCDSHPIEDEIGYRDGSQEMTDKCDQDFTDEILGLDENGIIHDSEEEKEEVYIPKRKLPKLPKTTSHGVSRLHFLKKETEGGTIMENLVDEAAAELIMLADEEDIAELESNRTFSIDEKFVESELQHSAGGSSGGDDSWSLSQDYMAMCDGKQYLNITFDGESESKTSTQEPSEESPSPEFIFDQEMIEDGEFSSQPMEISRDSSLGLLSSLALDRTDLLFELGDGVEIDMLASQETLEPTSDGKGSTPEKQDTLNDSVDFDDGDLIAASTPFTELGTVDREVMNTNLNETYALNEDDVNVSSQINNKCLNSTYTQDNEIPISSQVDTVVMDNLNSTFTKPNAVEATTNVSETVSVHVKDDLTGKGAMVDSGISMRGSLTESGISMTSMRGSMAESGVSMKGSLNLMEVSLKGKMADSGISVQSAMLDSNNGLQKVIAEIDDKVGDDVNKGLANGKCNSSGNGVNEEVDGILGDGVKIDDKGDVGLTRDEVNRSMDDRKLIKDLKDGHQRKERPISFLSTTSADTGYVPDTDSEHGTLTLNSPQEWMERGYYGNTEHTDTLPLQRNLLHDFQAEKMKLEPIPVESDSDFGTMTGDTDNEADRPEVVQPVDECESQLEGVDMGDPDIELESEDEITQVEDIKCLNSTVTLDNQGDGTFTADPPLDQTHDVDSTFTLPDSQTEIKEDTSGETESLSIVTIEIVDKESDENNKNVVEKGIDNTEKKNEKSEKIKTPKKKKFNVVKDFKKPNTTNVVSKLSEYLKAPLPVKPKEDKSNTEEAKNKRNSLKGKIDLSKVTSKLNIDVKIVEEKMNGNSVEKKKIIEKEPVKKIKRTPPKSKWDAIMNKIDDEKDHEKVKPKTEVKSKLEFLRIPPPAPPKKEEEQPKPKPKRRISAAIPDYSKVQSKLKYSAPPPAPKPKKEELPSQQKTETNGRKSTNSPNHSKTYSPGKSVTESSRRKSTNTDSSPSRNKTESPTRAGKGESPTRVKSERSRKLSRDLSRMDRSRNLSGDSPKRPDIKDKALHIDLADSLDGRGSRTGTGSVMSSRQSSTTDMSTTGVDEEVGLYSKKQLPGIERTLSLQSSERRDSTSAVSEVSEAGSQDVEQKSQNAEANQTRRKSSLIPPTTSLDSLTPYAGVGSSGGGGGVILRGAALTGRARIVKPVIRQHSAPSPLVNSAHNSVYTIKPSLFTNKAPTRNLPSKRTRNQNRNKTSTKTKKEAKEKPKPPETVLAEVHTQEVHRLEALCESRTKQLNMVKLQLHTSNQAFDGMSSVVNYLAHDLEGFSCPELKSEIKRLQEQVSTDEKEIDSLAEQRTNLDHLIAKLKEEHIEYRNKLESETEETMVYQKESLEKSHHEEILKVREKTGEVIADIKSSHKSVMTTLQLDHTSTIERMKIQHRENIMALQKKQEDQMEELHKQHQDKLEDITGRFDSIKVTLSDKVETLRSECDRLRDRARACEDALQRDSDYKVQCAIAPYKTLPQEIDSLKMVVEMKSEEINKLRTQNIELQKKLEELPIAQEKIISLDQKKENLEAIISMKTDHEKTLHERCQNLMKKYDKESRANKRLSMEYEELMWKLTESFSETDEMGSQEALFYKKLGMSPETVDVTGSPNLGGRRIRTPSGSEGSSPSKSPAYRRTLSSSVDDREEKKLKRRSGNFLLDERNKHRPNSPMSKNQNQNPLTKSWSPGTPLSSSPTRSVNTSQNRMSQSWCVDVFEETEDDIGKIPKSQSNLESESSKNSPRRRRQRGEEDLNKSANSNNNDKEVSVSSSSSPQTSPRMNQSGSDESENGESVKTNGINGDVTSADEEREIIPLKSRSGRETVTLSEAVLDECDSRLDSDISQQNGHSSPNNSQSNSADIISDDLTSSKKNVNDSAILTTETVSSPVSRLPVSVPEVEKREIRKPVTRSHRESAV